MIATHTDANSIRATETSKMVSSATEARHERWAHCHVNWTGVWVGALTTFGLLLLFGLAGTALGAYTHDPEHRMVDVKKIGVWTLVLSVCGAFFASAAGGWSAAKIAGILHSEPAIIHGAAAWLVTVPMLIACAALDASSLFGGWYSGLSPNTVASANPPFAHPDPLVTNSSLQDLAEYRSQQADYNRKVQQWNEETPKVVRNSALIAITALLMGMVGSVIGGWMASGEPMNFSHYQTRKPVYHPI